MEKYFIKWLFSLKTMCFKRREQSEKLEYKYLFRNEEFRRQLWAFLVNIFKWYSHPLDSIPQTMDQIKWLLPLCGLLQDLHLLGVVNSGFLQAREDALGLVFFSSLYTQCQYYLLQLVFVHLSRLQKDIRNISLCKKKEVYNLGSSS